MLDVMNPSEVLDHHAGPVEPNTFKLSLDRATSASRLLLSLALVIGQHARRDEPIKVHLKDFVDSKCIYLTLVNREEDLPKSGICLAIRPSLLHPNNEVESLLNSQNFPKNMSTVVKLSNMNAYVLQNTMLDKDTTNDKPPLLGHSIMSASYSTLVKRKRYIDAPPKFTHNPSGKLAHQLPEWSTSELDLFNSIGIEVEGRRETTYVAVFILCWLCVFLLLENEDRLFKPRTFKVIVLMTTGETFSLAITVLASTYRGINVISRTQRLKYFKDVEARRIIHEGFGAKVGCTLLNENRNTFLFDDGTLDQIQIIYLSSLRSGYVSLHHYDSFYIEPYLPYRFSRQFGFCQDIPSVISRKVKDHSNVSYDKVLIHHLTGAMAEVEGEDKSTSNAKSKINFKHKRGRRNKKPRAADLEGDEIDFGNAFDNIPIPSDIPNDLVKVGDIDFEMGWSFNIHDAMVEEEIEPLNVLIDRTIPEKGKQIHIESDLAKWVILLPLHRPTIPPSTSPIRVTPASQGIFTSAIKVLENEYLTLLRQNPFDKVSDIHGESPKVYKAIQVMHCNPKPLNRKVDEYVWAVKGYLSLKASLFDYRRSNLRDEARHAVVEELKLTESNYNATLTKNIGLEEESASLKKKKDELLKEL
ncbi:ATP-dependent RNA helicase DBP8 [Bienertia sinuspersici]